MLSTECRYTKVLIVVDYSKQKRVYGYDNAIDATFKRLSGKTSDIYKIGVLFLKILIIRNRPILDISLWNMKKTKVEKSYFQPLNRSIAIP